MRLRIHRGANEIGGSCVELEAQGCSILLDLGLPLDADEPDASLLPEVSGLTDGSNPKLLGVVLSHTHCDHNGLTGFVHPALPVFMGAHAKAILLASRPFLRHTSSPQTVCTYTSEIPFKLGPFRVGATPSLSLKPGARLVREWRGRTHTVTVTEDGFEYAGTSYPSLTRIANKITGGHWSGPRFFGLPAAGTGRSVDGGRNG
jgi:hypothetical protein